MSLFLKPIVDGMLQPSDLNCVFMEQRTPRNQIRLDCGWLISLRNSGWGSLALYRPFKDLTSTKFLRGTKWELQSRGSEWRLWTNWKVRAQYLSKRDWKFVSATQAHNAMEEVIMAFLVVRSMTLLTSISKADSGSWGWSCYIGVSFCRTHLATEVALSMSYYDRGSDKRWENGRDRRVDNNFRLGEKFWERSQATAS
jgi:hypothetical protein